MAADSSPTQTAQLVAEKASPRISTARQIAINLFWFANNFHWIALLNVVIPAQVAVYFGRANQAANVPLVVVVGTLAAFVVNPLTGSLSDYVRTRLGRRRPFMLAGTIFNVLTLIAFAFLGQTFITTPLSTPTILAMALLFLALEITNNAANAPWSAIIADQVPAAQRGSASGWYGLMTLFGVIAGSLVAGSIVHYGASQQIDAAFKQAFAREIFIFYLILAAVQAIFVILTIVLVRETLPEHVYEFRWTDFWLRFRLEARKYPDFAWILLTRVLVMSGIWAINYFILYYFTDVLHRANATADIGTIFFPIVLAASLISTYVGGTLSDRIGRKVLVYLTGIMMTVTCLLFIFVHTFSVALVAAIFFGLGYGAYTSVDWALATDVLPPVDQYGKDMGIWSAAGIIPQVFGVILGGIILTTLHRPGIDPSLGYSVLFAVLVVLFAVGTFLVSRVKGAR
jgi:MFS family permease